MVNGIVSGDGAVEGDEVSLEPLWDVVPPSPGVDHCRHVLVENFHLCCHIPCKKQKPERQQGCGSLPASQGCRSLSAQSSLWREGKYLSLFCIPNSRERTIYLPNLLFNHLLPEELVGDLVPPFVDLREINIVDKDGHVLPLKHGGDIPKRLYIYIA